MNSRLFRLAVFLSLAVPVALAGPAPARNQDSSADPAVDAYISALRADFRADKVVLITEAMQFSEKEGNAFWPVYKRYETELAALNDDRIRLIKSYAEQFAALTDSEAKVMAQKALDLEGRRVELRKKYFAQFNQVLPGLTVAKFFQLEYRLDLLVNLRLASELPALLVRPTAETSNAASPGRN